jgi:predicted GNAT family N-acyltransferase
MPEKKHIVRLTAQEREICRQRVRKLKGSGEKVRRARILLKADADGPGWTDQQIADALCKPQDCLIGDLATLHANP